MDALLYGTAALVLFVCAVLSVRMLRTTGLEDIDLPSLDQDEKQDRDLGERIEALGARFVGMTLRWYGPARIRALDTRIRAAGRPHGLTVMMYLRRQTGFVVVGLGAFLVLALLDEVLIGALVLVVHLAWMRVWLTTTARTRRERIARELPDFLDVLAVTIAAGLGFRQAMERVSAFHTGPVGEEVRTALQEMSMGVSRRRAMIAVRERVDSPGMSAFVTALLQAEELGVPLGAAISNIAADVRQEHAQTVRQAAAKSGTKVSLVVTLLLVPGAMILIVGGLFLGNSDGLGAFLG